MKDHTFELDLVWTGNRGSGTDTYRSYDRTHEVRIAGKPVLYGSSAPPFRGNADRHNPEDLLVAALSACHLLSYLHACANAGVVVTAYEDHATAVMHLTPTGGHFTDALLRPRVTIAAGDATLAHALHERAHEGCFIAASVNFPVRCEPEILVIPSSVPTA